jgi:hypothetical protein
MMAWRTTGRDVGRLPQATVHDLRDRIADGTHGGFSQWLQRVTWNVRVTSGYAPCSTVFTHVRLTPSGTSFSLLHAVLHAWQPIHRVLSMTKP